VRRSVLIPQDWIAAIIGMRSNSHNGDFAVMLQLARSRHHCAVGPQRAGARTRSVTRLSQQTAHARPWLRLEGVCARRFRCRGGASLCPSVRSRPSVVRFIMDTACGVSPLPHPSPRLYTGYDTPVRRSVRVTHRLVARPCATSLCMQGEHLAPNRQHPDYRCCCRSSARPGRRTAITRRPFDHNLCRPYSTRAQTVQ
jgi:hypothetical protein